MRDDFPAAVKDTLAKRVGYTCSNPKCGMLTVGPHSDNQKVANIGVAAHITAASVGGPRYDVSIDPIWRASIENGIWLCQSCAKLVDSDVAKYPVALLHKWKTEAEERAGARLNKQLGATPQFAGQGEFVAIKPNGLYERKLPGCVVRFYLKGSLLYTEQEFESGAIAYCVIDQEGNVVENKLPYDLSEYTVEIPESLVLGREIQKLSEGFTQEDVRMKWGKRAIIIRDKRNRLANIQIEGGSEMNHIEKKFIVSLPKKHE